MELDFLLRFPVKPHVTSPVDFISNYAWGGICSLAAKEEFRNLGETIIAIISLITDLTFHIENPFGGQIVILKIRRSDGRRLSSRNVRKKKNSPRNGKIKPLSKDCA